MIPFILRNELQNSQGYATIHLFVHKCVMNRYYIWKEILKLLGLLKGVGIIAIRQVCRFDYNYYFPPGIDMTHTLFYNMGYVSNYLHALKF